MVPYVCGASCFLTARAMEQVKVDLGYSKWNVKLCGMSSGMAYGQLGAQPTTPSKISHGRA
jgi:transketolase